MKKTSIKVNALLNVIKQCLSIIFPLITYPYVSRVLGSDNLGRYSFSDSIVQLIITISMIGIPTYAVREGAMIRNDKKKLTDFCSEIFTINIITSTICYVLLAVLVISVDKIRAEYVFVAILSINMISKCFGRNWLNSIFEDYLYISIRYVVIHCVSLIAIFIFVRTKEDVLIYVVIMALSEFLSNLFNLFYTRRMVPYSLRFSKEMLRHLKPILILFCSSIASVIYVKSDITLLGFMRESSEVGVYTLSSRVYSIVKSVMNAIITVTIPRLAFYLGKQSKEGDESYNSLLNELGGSLVLFLLPATVGLFCLSDDVMFLLGGEEFTVGGTSLKILCGALVFAVFGCYFAEAIIVANRKEKVFFQATVFSALINILLNIVFIPLFGISGAAFTTLLSEMSIVAICGIAAAKIFKPDRKELLRNSLCALIECISIICISIICYKTIDILVIRIIVIITLSVVVYLIVLIGFKNAIFFKVINGRKRKLRKNNTNV